MQRTYPVQSPDHCFDHDKRLPSGSEKSNLRVLRSGLELFWFGPFAYTLRTIRVRSIPIQKSTEPGPSVYGHISNSDLPRTDVSMIRKATIRAILAQRTFRVHQTIWALSVSHKPRGNPIKPEDPPRTLLRKFRVHFVDLTRTDAGPSAYFRRTFRVPLNRKQEKHVFHENQETSRWLAN